MKPATKKTIIIVLAVLIVATIVYFLFFRKQGWEKEIDKLNIAESYKDQLRKAVKQILSDPTYTKEGLETSAQAANLTYDQYLVIEAAFNLGWQSGITNGVLDIRPKN